MKTTTYAVLPALVCGAVLALSPTLRAQDAAATPAAAPETTTATPEAQRRVPLIERLTKDLNLTDDQQAKIKPILQDRRSKAQAIRGDASLSKEQRKDKMKEVSQSSNDQIKAILTPDQQKKFDQVMEEIKANRAKRGQS
jgi:Spy/CpxP family protein refolding chaperone